MTCPSLLAASQTAAEFLGDVAHARHLRRGRPAGLRRGSGGTTASPSSAGSCSSAAPPPLLYGVLYLALGGLGLPARPPGRHGRLDRARQRAAPAAHVPRRGPGRTGSAPRSRPAASPLAGPARDQRRPRLAEHLRRLGAPVGAADHPRRHGHRRHRSRALRGPAVDLPPDRTARRSIAPRLVNVVGVSEPSEAGTPGTDPTAAPPSPWPAPRPRGRSLGPPRRGRPRPAPLIAVLLFGRISAPIGPFDATLAFRPTGGGAAVAVPPLGSLDVDVYDGPLRLDIALQRVDQERAQRAGHRPRPAGRRREPGERRPAQRRGAPGLDDGRRRDRRRRPHLAGRPAPPAGTGASPPASPPCCCWRPPGWAPRPGGPRPCRSRRYTGLLVNANSLIGSAQDIVARFDAYRASLEDLVANVGTPLLDDLRAARARRHRRHRGPPARVRPAPQPRRVRPDAPGRGPVPGRRRARHRRHHRLGQRAGEPADRLGRPARRPLRLHPRQPRLRRDGGAHRRAAQRHRARRLGRDRRRHRDRRRAGPAASRPDKSTGDDDAGDDVLAESGQ